MTNIQSLQNTALCYWWFMGECTYNKCTFSHDPGSITPVIVPLLFKTVPCQAEQQRVGSCPYKFRCHYIHPNDHIERLGSFIRVSTPDIFTHALLLYRLGIIEDGVNAP